jgi:hypothetical protein
MDDFHDPQQIHLLASLPPAAGERIHTQLRLVEIPLSKVAEPALRLRRQMPYGDTWIHVPQSYAALNYSPGSGATIDRTPLQC